MPLEARAADFANPNPLGDGTHVERLYFFRNCIFAKDFFSGAEDGVYFYFMQDT